MSATLLDVNVLVALLDPDHVMHERAHRWFASARTSTWLTCPITENGAIRILGLPGYPSPRPSHIAIAGFRALAEAPGHAFIPDSIRLIDALDESHLLTSRQVTDAYLLALAKVNGAKFATFDRRIVAGVVPGGDGWIEQIP